MFFKNILFMKKDQTSRTVIEYRYPPVETANGWKRIFIIAIIRKKISD